MKNNCLIMLILIFTINTVKAQINSVVGYEDKKAILKTIKVNGPFLGPESTKIVDKSDKPINSDFNSLFTDSIILIRLYGYKNIKPIDNSNFYNHFNEYFVIDSNTFRSPFYYVLRYKKGVFKILGTIQMMSILDVDTFIDKLMFTNWGVPNNVFFEEILTARTDSFMLWSSFSFLNEFVFIGKNLYAAMDNGKLLSAESYFKLFFLDELKNRYQKG